MPTNHRTRAGDRCHSPPPYRTVPDADVRARRGPVVDLAIPRTVLPPPWLRRFRTYASQPRMDDRDCRGTLRRPVGGLVNARALGCQMQSLRTVVGLMVMACTGCMSVTRVPKTELWVYDREGQPYPNLRIDLEAARESRPPAAYVWRSEAQVTTDRAGRVQLDGASDLVWVGAGVFVHGTYPPGYQHRLAFVRPGGAIVRLPLTPTAFAQVLLERASERALMLTFYHHDLPLPDIVAQPARSTAFLAQAPGADYFSRVEHGIVAALKPQRISRASYPPGLELDYDSPSLDIEVHVEDTSATSPIDDFGPHTKAPQSPIF